MCTIHSVSMAMSMHSCIIKPSNWIFFYCDDVDIDECEESQDNCHENATCMNSFGNFSCSCNIGFEGDGVECISKLIKF